MTSSLSHEHVIDVIGNKVSYLTKQVLNMNREYLKSLIDSVADQTDATKSSITAKYQLAKSLAPELKGRDLAWQSTKRLGKWAKENPGEVILGGVAALLFDPEDLS
jgi:hypothetical protein